MNIINNHNFIHIKEFIKNNTPIHLETDFPDAYILVKNFTFSNQTKSKMNVISIINTAINILLQRKDSKNILCSGHQQNKDGVMFCKTPIQALNILKTKKWAHLFRLLGDQNSIAILTNSTIVHKEDSKLFILCGNLSYPLSAKQMRIISRKSLFLNKLRCRKLSENDFYTISGEFLGDPELSKIDRSDMADVKTFRSTIGDSQGTVFIGFKKNFSNLIKKYNKLNLNALFKSYFAEDIGKFKKMDTKRIENFLFMISKKTMADIFNYDNFRILKSKISLLLAKNRFEQISEIDLLHHFKINALNCFKKKCSRNEFHVRQRLVKNLLLFIFDEIFIPVLSNFFYFTNMRDNPKIVIFLREQWNKKSSLLIKDYLDRYFVKSNMQQKPPLKIIPKNQGFRFITNFSYNNFYDYKESNNYLFQVMRILYKTYPFNIGNSILNYSMIFEELSTLKCLLKPNMDFSHIPNAQTRTLSLSKFLENYEQSEVFYPENKKLYFLKFDVKDCFDSIRHDELFEALEKIYFRKKYHLKKYKKITEIGRYLKATNYFSVDGELSLRNCIIQEESFDTTKYGVEVKTELIDFVKNSGNTYKHKGYKRKRGIPQGSVISPFLCALFYDYLDGKTGAKNSPNLKILRYVDDFLVTSTDTEAIVNYFKDLIDLHIDVNIDKIEANFRLEDYVIRDSDKFGHYLDVSTSNPSEDKKDSNLKNEGAEMLEIGKNNETITKATPYDFNVNKVDFVKWCGMKVYDDGGFKYAYSYENLKHSLYYNSHRGGESVMFKMTRMIKNKLKKQIFARNNSRKYESIYDLFYFFHVKLKLFARRMAFINDKFVSKVRNKGLREAIRKTKQYDSGIPENLIRKIFDETFIKVNKD
ncbi:Telomerase reverse transcriptase [Dictyocoela roeselum]|nr:Telomerase reverse transcriptase [Dictyocoela roeselum]